MCIRDSYRAFLIPLMVRLVNLSDTLALSVETRGFTTYPAPYTVYRPVYLQAKDGAFAALSALCALGAVSYTHLDVYKRQE